MKAKIITRPKPPTIPGLPMKMCLLIVAISAVLGCRPQAVRESKASHNSPDPLAIVLAPHSGNSPLDLEIARLQKQVSSGHNPTLILERLGWKFVAKARASHDPGYYTLAQQCALAIEAREKDSPAAWLLRGHALHQTHHFREAEILARKLTNVRAAPFDYGLLSDALMEQGKLNEAIEACQRMLDLRPDLHSYARAAHLRWLKGDVTGAIELMELACSAASPRDPEAAAWVHTRLASYTFQAGQFTAAKQACELALHYQNDYPNALVLQGKMLLSEANHGEAAILLQRALSIQPQAEALWMLADAYHAAGSLREARAVEARLRRQSTDPRTLALFLATRGESPELAGSLAKKEIASRADVFTHDALAWCLAAKGDWEEARFHIKAALAEGTEDGRLFLHAAVIAENSGRHDESLRWARKARALQHLLLPSERAHLERHPSADPASATFETSPTKNFPIAETQ